MGTRSARPRLARLLCAAAAAGALAACEAGPPAPVIMNGPGTKTAGEPMMPMTAPPRPLPGGEQHHIVVRSGQSLKRIAAEYHVSQKAIIAANHLAPPYKLEAGQRLVIPRSGPPVPRIAMPAPPSEPRSRGTIGVIPLDEPSPAAAPPHASSPPHSAPIAPAAVPAAKQPASRSAAEEARAEPQAGAPPLPHGGRLPWPVRGRILAGYGASSGGTHNDGINIGAPRGAPIEAVDEGEVAYAGNELRGYGNLVLIKHPNGFISAYAHCEDLLVKRGDKVRRGQIIAKVGTTGGLSEPQLHFELRRGKRAVDPREFLAPAPSAESSGARRSG